MRSNATKRTRQRSMALSPTETYSDWSHDIDKKSIVSLFGGNGQEIDAQIAPPKKKRKLLIKHNHHCLIKQKQFDPKYKYPAIKSKPHGNTNYTLKTQPKSGSVFEENRKLRKENKSLKETKNDYKLQLDEFEKSRNKLYFANKKLQETVENMIEHHRSTKNEFKSQLDKTRKEIDKLKNANNKLENQYIEQRQEINLLNGSSEKINTLNFKELDALEMELQNGMKSIQQARERIFENKYFCIACLKNHKNMMIDRCHHIVLCEECATNLEPKRCPICQIAFRKFTKVMF